MTVKIHRLSKQLEIERMIMIKCPLIDKQKELMECEGHYVPLIRN